MNLTKQELQRLDREERDRLLERAARPRTVTAAGPPTEMDPAVVAEMRRGERSRAHAAGVIAEATAEAEAEAKPARQEAARLADALDKARAEHLGALGELDALAASVASAVVAGKGVEAAEKAEAAGREKVTRLANRVEVLEAAARDAAAEADAARAAAVRAACRRRLGPAQEAAAKLKAELEALKARHAEELNAALDGYDLALTLAGQLANHAATRGASE